MRRTHRMPFGAEIRADGGVRFRLWAPEAGRVALVLDGDDIEMTAEGEGWFVRDVAEAGPGTRYHHRIDGGTPVADPASRFQPEDVHGASEVIDPAAFDWPDADWHGRPWEEAVVYELHLGGFTNGGGYADAVGRLDHLVETGITAVELMPLSEAPGRRNWGYDGVYPFAPEAAYGRPEDLKRLIAAAHARGLMVLLDVVYNHFGPEGNYLHLYAPTFFTERYHTPWGAAINFDGEESRTVRAFFIENALYWLEEYRFDGLRLDAVHAIFDRSEPDILFELAETVRRRVAPGRHVHLVLENGDNAARYLGRDREGGIRAYDAQWNDDAHHALHVLLTGEAEGYYADYVAAPANHLGRVLAEGFAFQGELSPYHDGRPRGEPSAHLPPTAFVNFLQNHDQIGNRAFGERIDALAPRRAVEAALAVLLLAPSVPLLFMGEEWGTTRPFLFFCDFDGPLAEAVRDGRRNEFARFARFSDPEVRDRIPDPVASETFARSVLDWSEIAAQPHRGRLDLVRRLLTIRHREIVPRLAGAPGGDARWQAARTAVAVRWRLADGSALHLRANLGAEPVAAFASAPGRLLFATDESVPRAIADGRLPPWSVGWLLDAPPEENG